MVTTRQGRGGGGGGGGGRGQTCGQGAYLSVQHENEEFMRVHSSQAEEILGTEVNPIDGEHGKGLSSHTSTRKSHPQSGQGQQRKPNQGAKVPNHEDQRTKVIVVNNRFIEGDVTRNLINAIKDNYREAWPRWHKVPRATKDLIWENFKLRHWWDNLTDFHMRKVWNQNASARFRDLIYKAKKKALKDAYNELGREPDTLDMIGRGPHWMSGHIWDELVEKHWSAEAYKKKCNTARENRMTEKHGFISKHTNTSIRQEAHKQKMEKELDDNVDDLEVFHRTYRKNGRTREFVVDKSKQVGAHEYGHGECSKTGSECSVTSRFRGPNDGIIMLSIEDAVSAAIAKMQKEYEIISKERQKILEEVTETCRKLAEEHKKVVERFEEMARLFEACINSRSAAGSREQERQNSHENQ